MWDGGSLSLFCFTQKKIVAVKVFTVSPLLSLKWLTTSLVPW